MKIRPVSTPCTSEVKMRPLLQIALDELTMENALKVLSGGVDEIVDIIECGTVLIGSEGRKVVQQMRERYPHKKLVADFKIADSGKVMAGMLLDGKPDYLTVICAANQKTMKAVVDEIKDRNLTTEAQMELYGNWTFEELEQWKKIGINHVVLHHSVDEKDGWTQKELDLVRKLCEHDIHVTVTGGISYESIELFKGLPIFCIIAGRSIRKAENPAQEAQRMKDRIIEIWGN